MIQTNIHLPNRKEVKEISKKLVKERLVAGTMVSKGFSHYHWKDEIREEEYFDLKAFTIEENKETIKEKVKELSSEKTPAIYFKKIETEKELGKWIEKELE